MPADIVLLTGARRAPLLTRLLREQAPAARIVSVETLDGLAENCRPGVRLIAFCTAVIVPAEILNALETPAYNFHPGPPTYPGRHPESFAVYDGALRFGATAHVMMPRVDEGPIIGVEWFDVPPGTRQLALGELAYRATWRLFARLSAALATRAAPLPVLPVAWSGRKTTRRDYDRLRYVPPDIDAAELERRIAAFGEDPDTPVTLTLHGRRFVMTHD